jgi:hypothetical protein
MEYLLWFIQKGPIAPLVTTSPAGTATAQAGVLGQPGTQVLIGGTDLDYGGLSGGRLAGGWWSDDARTFGIEARFFFLGEKTKSFPLTSDNSGNPILARPIFSVQAGAESSELAAFPGTIASSLAISTSTELWGTEVNLLEELYDAHGPACIHFLLGFLYLDLHENLQIAQAGTVLANNVVGFNGAAVALGNQLVLTDSFDARSQFYGVQAGFQGEFVRGRLLIDWAAKLGVGDSHRLSTIMGSTKLIAPDGTAAAAPGGLLALPSNIGAHSDDDFAFTMQAAIKLKWLVTQHITAGIGYDFLLWDNVVRPGNQIDRTVDLRQVPSSLQFVANSNATRPDGTVHGHSFWAEGLAFEVGLRY